MARKTIDQIRSELNQEKAKNRKLRQQLRDAERGAFFEAAVIAQNVKGMYSERAFPVPDADAPPQLFAAEGARTAAQAIFDQLTIERKRRTKD